MSSEFPRLTQLVSAPVEPRRLSADLADLLVRAEGRSLTLGQLEDILQGRGFALFILLLSLPFVFPIAIPGLSVPFGLVILFMGMRIALGRKPSLPRFILGREIKYATLEKIVNCSARRWKRWSSRAWTFSRSGPGCSI
jgi:hypothetical protein